MTIQKRNRRLRALAYRAAAFDIYSGGDLAPSATLSHRERRALQRYLVSFWRAAGLPACQRRVGRGFVEVVA